MLVAACCMAMTWLTYRLAEGGMAEPLPAGVWSWDMVALLFAVCLFVLQSSTLSQTMENGWRRTAVLVGAWVLGFAFIVVVQAFLLIDDLSNVPLWPVSLRQPLWLAVGIGFLAAALVLGRACSPALYKIGGETMKKSMTGAGSPAVPRAFLPAGCICGATICWRCCFSRLSSGCWSWWCCWWLPGVEGGLDDASALAIPHRHGAGGQLFRHPDFEPGRCGRQLYDGGRLGPSPAGTCVAAAPWGCGIFFSAVNLLFAVVLQAVTTGIGALLGVGGSFDLLAKMPPVLWGLLLVAPTAVAVLDKGAVRRFGPKAASVLYLLFLFACIGGQQPGPGGRGSVAVLPGVGVYRRPGGGRRPWQHLAAARAGGERIRKRTVHLDNSAQLH